MKYDRRLYPLVHVIIKKIPGRKSAYSAYVAGVRVFDFDPVKGRFYPLPRQEYPDVWGNTHRTEEEFLKEARESIAKDEACPES